MHDKKMADKDKMEFPDDSFVLQDLGYVGYLHDNVHTIMNEKKPYKKDFTEEQKENNRLKSRERIHIEHIICGIKRLKIVTDVCRAKGKKFMDEVMFLACSLHNLRVKFRKNQCEKCQV